MVKRLVGACALVWALLWAVTSYAYTFNEAHPRLYLTPERIANIQARHVAVNSYEWRQVLICAARTDLDGVWAKAFVYTVTDDEAMAASAVSLINGLVQVPLTANFNSNGRLGNRWACIYDWLHNYSGFDRQQVITYVNALPKDRDPANPTVGYWNWYPMDDAGNGHPYFNGAVKSLWGFPVWGLASYPENPNWKTYVDAGLVDRWAYVKHLVGDQPGLASWGGGLPESGRDYGAGTMRNVMFWLEACATAFTDFDVNAEAPTMKAALEAFIHDFVWVDQPYNGKEFHFYRAPFGDNAQKQDGVFGSDASMAWAVARRWPNDPFAGNVAWFLTAQPGAAQYPARDARNEGVWACIYKDGSVVPREPSGLPLHYHAPWVDMLIARSNWTAPGVEPRMYTTFRSGNTVWFNQNSRDQGGFTLFAHGDFLFTHGGYYDEVGGYAVWAYHQQTIGQNSMRFVDDGELWAWHPNEDAARTEWIWNGDTLNVNSGGQKFPYRETRVGVAIDGVRYDGVAKNRAYTIHDSGDLARWEGTDDHVYGLGVFGNAYANAAWDTIYAADRLAKAHFRPKVKQAEREFLYLRNKDLLILFDRAVAVADSIHKYWDFHSIFEPTVEGVPSVVAVPGHIETYAAAGFTVAGTRGQARVWFLGDPGLTLTKIGGVGYEYWMNGTNYDPYPNSHNDLGGNWRMEAHQQGNNLATVIAAGDAGAVVERAVGWVTTPAEWAGVQVDSLVCIYNRTRSGEEVVSYLSATVMTEHMVFDLVPGASYTVNDGQHELGDYTASSAGVLSFTSGPVKTVLIKPSGATLPWRSPALALLMVILLGAGGVWMIYRRRYGILD